MTAKQSEERTERHLGVVKKSGSDLNFKLRVTKKGVKVTAYKYCGQGIWTRIETHWYRTIAGAEEFANIMLKKEIEYKSI